MATEPSITISGKLQSVIGNCELLRSKLATRVDNRLLDQVQVHISIDGDVLGFTLDPVEIHISGPTPSSDGGY